MNNNKGESKDTPAGNEAVGNFRKAVDWIRDNKETVTLLLTIIGVLGAWIGIVLLFLQTTSLQQQTRILQSDYESRSRPYLAVENIIIQQDGNSSPLDIVIDITNHGQLPTGKVYLPKVVLAPHIDFNEKTRTFEIEAPGNISCPTPPPSLGDEPWIAACEGLLTFIGVEGFPPDSIFFPETHYSIIVHTDKSQFEAAVGKWGVMNIGIAYLSGERLHYYIAEATIQDGKWVVKYHRGD